MEDGRQSTAIWWAGVIFGVVIVGAISEVARFPSLMEFVKEYQTLIAGIAALIGALFTVRQIRKQIENSQRHHDDLIDRNLVAAKSVLPLVLSDLHEYAERCLRISFDIACQKKLSAEYCPPTPGAFEVLRDVIKYAPNERQLELTNLILHLQAQSARLSANLQKYEPILTDESREGYGIGGDMNFPAYIDILAAEDLMFRLGRLFSFARGDDEQSSFCRLDIFEQNLEHIGVNVKAWIGLSTTAKHQFERYR